MALRPDGAILLAKKEHPGSVGSVYEFGSGARSGADGRQVRLTPLAAWRETPFERHARSLATAIWVSGSKSRLRLCLRP